MRIIDITATEGGFIVTLERRDPFFLFLRTRTDVYFTPHGISYFDAQGRKMESPYGLKIHALFTAIYDRSNQRYWDPVTHPGPEHKAAAVLREHALTAQRTLA